MTIENEVPETDEDLTAVDESIFEESSSLAHSLELESSRQPLDAKVRLFGDVAMPSKETQPATEKSADFVIGRSSPTRNSCNSSRLRAPKSAFDFFNQSTASSQCE